MLDLAEDRPEKIPDGLPVSFETSDVRELHRDVVIAGNRMSKCDPCFVTI